MDPWHFAKKLRMWASHRSFFFIKLFLKSIFTWLNSMWRCARPSVRGHAVRCCRRPYWALANMFKHWTYDFHWFSSLRCISTEIPHSFWRTLACPSKLLWKSFKALKSPKIPAGECMQDTECLNALHQTSMFHIVFLSSYSMLLCTETCRKVIRMDLTRPNNTAPKEI